MPPIDTSSETNLSKDIERKVIDYWDARSEGYSLATLKSLRNQDTRIKRLISNFINYDRKLDVADMGTGAGFAAISMALDGHSVTGVDLSEDMLEYARRNAFDLGVNVRFVKGNIEDPPLEKGMFDLVIAHNSVWDLCHPEAAYAAWKELLRPGGIITIIDGNYYLHNFDKDYKRRYDFNELNNRGVNDGVHGKTNVDHVDFSIIDELSKSLPLSRVRRPAWDVSALTGIGMTDIHVKSLDVSAYSVLKRHGLVEVPMKFIVCARAPLDDMSPLDDALRAPIVSDEDLIYLMHRTAHQDVSVLRVLKALSDENRLKMVGALNGGRMSVAQLAALLETSPSLTSHNLRILRDAGIVSAEKNGKATRYSLNGRYHLKVLLEMCGCFVKKNGEGDPKVPDEVSDPEPLVAADAPECRRGGESGELRRLRVPRLGNVVGVRHRLPEHPLVAEFVRVALGRGVQDDGDLGPVEPDTHEGYRGGDVNVLGKQLDRVPGGTGIDYSLLLHGEGVDPLLLEVLDSLEGLGTLGRDQLHRLKLLHGGAPESVDSTECTRRDEDLSFMLDGALEHHAAVIVVDEGSDGHDHHVHSTGNHLGNDFLGGLLAGCLDDEVGVVQFVFDGIHHDGLGQRIRESIGELLPYVDEIDALNLGHSVCGPREPGSDGTASDDSNPHTRSIPPTSINRFL